MGNNKYEILFITHSNMNDLSFGDSNNDSKVINAFPPNITIQKFFPKRDKKGAVHLLNGIRFLIKIAQLSFRKEQILLIRGSRLAYFPVMFKKFTKNRIILNLGCTPLYTVENRAFLKNEQKANLKKMCKNLFFYLEFQLEKLVLRQSDAFFVENVKAKKLIALYGAETSKVSILPYYVQDYFMNDYNPKDYHRGDAFKLGYIGRFHFYDNLPLIIKSLLKLRENRVKFKIILVGEGKTKDYIEKLVRENNLSEYAEFLGARPHEEIPKLLNEIHCLIVPMSKNLNPTTIPIKILEGILMGKVIITNNTANIKSLFYLNDDLVIDELNSTVLFNTLMKIIENYDSYANKAIKLRKRHKNFRTKQNFNKIIINSLSNTLHKFRNKNEIIKSNRMK